MEKLAEIGNKVQSVLDQIRPYLQIDNGDIKLISVSEDGIVKVAFLGNCDTCSLIPMTLRAGVERVIMHEVPEIKRIERVIVK